MEVMYLLDTIKHDIYPPYLNLLRVNNSTNAADVLDLNINKENRKFSISLFDKRQNLPFKTICFPHTNSNIPINVCYNTFSSQITRLALINTYERDFRSAIINLISIIRDRGYSKKMLRSLLITTLNKYKFIKDKYRIDINNTTVKHYIP